MTRVVLTGVSGGLGGSLLARLLEDPAVEVDGLCRSADRVPLRSPRLRLHECDLEDADALDALDGLDLERPVDALVHAAALGTNLSFEEARLDDWRRYLEVNLFAPVVLTRSIAARIPPGGSIVFVNSGLGLRASATSVPYSSAKAALKGFADAIRPSMNARGISVTTVYPGQIATAMLMQNARLAGRPWEPERYIQPDDLSELIMQIIRSPQSTQLTDVSVRPPQEVW